MLRWAVRLNIGIDGLANLSRFAERMYANAGVQNAIRAEEDTLAHDWRGEAHDVFDEALENRPALGV